MISRHRWIAIGCGLIYGIFYLYAIGDLSLTPPPTWGAYAIDLPLRRMLSARSTLMFEAIAVIEAGYLIWLVSPLNLLIAGLLGGLLAANVHGALYLRSQARVCADGRRGLLLGAMPALLAGGACCAPSLILLLGIPALGALGAFFAWLVPISVLALGLNRLWQHRKGAPNLLAQPVTGSEV